MAGNSVIRSLLGGTLPLAGPASKNIPNSLLSHQHRFPTLEMASGSASWSCPNLHLDASFLRFQSPKTRLTQRNLVYAKLNPHWAGSLLGLIQVAIIPIPVFFYRYGHKIRMKSTLIQSMQQDKEKLESKRRSGVRAAKLEKAEDEIVKVYSRTV